jgi:hypothetical protein
MFNKILLAYNGSREGKSALLACAEIASFAKSETHLLAVAGMPSSMFLTEGFLPEELLEEEKKRAQEILDEGTAAAQAARIQRHRPPRGRRAGRGDLPPRRRAQVRRDRGRPPAAGFVGVALVARVGGEDPARLRAVQHLRGADEELRRGRSQWPLFAEDHSALPALMS